MAFPGHYLRRQGLDKHQRPGIRSTVRLIAERGWNAHFYPLRFQKGPISDSWRPRAKVYAFVNQMELKVLAFCFTVS